MRRSHVGEAHEPRKKHQRVADLLAARIRQKDYTLRELPTEAELAIDAGVSRSTARKALQLLIETGQLERRRHGRLALKEQRPHKLGPRLAFLAPAFASVEFDKWREAVFREAAALSASVRLVDYVHWDDPNVSYALSRFDATFLVPSTEPISGLVQQRLRRARNVFVLGADFSRLGIPSVQLLPPVSVHRLGDHMREQGHRRIDSLNTQPHNDVIDDRLAQWELWKRLHGIDGEVIDEPVRPFEHPTPRAYDVMKDRLRDGQKGACALLCITDDAATGAIRAYHEAGLIVGRDVAVCTVEGAHLAPYRVPSRTCLVEPPAGPYISACLQSIAAEMKCWEGPLLVEACDISLFVGESTTISTGSNADTPHALHAE